MNTKMIEGVVKLISVIGKELEKEIKAGRVEPEIEQCFYWKVEDFTYTEKGVSYSKMSGAYTTKKNWIRAFMILIPAIQDTEEYKRFILMFSEFYPTRTTFENDASLIAKKILRIYLTEGKEKYKESFTNLLYQLQKEFSGDPENCMIRMQLHGITLESKKIQLSNGVTLRQTIQADLETPQEVSLRVSGMYHDSHQYPSVILEAQFELLPSFNNGLHGMKHLQDLQNKYVVILRLYAVGSVESLESSITSDSILQSNRYGGSLFSHKILHPFNQYFLPKEKQDSLVDFVKTIEPLIPHDFYSITDRKTTFLSIAFDRYSDALLERGIFEKRVANIVMGLEALFSNENMELAYKLRQRIAKAMSCIRKNALDTASLIKEAYKIRSTFAHGGLTSEKDRKKISSLYNSEQEFVVKISDILRLGIIICILCNIEKEKFIRLLDESMIDYETSLQVKEMLVGVSKFS